MVLALSFFKYTHTHTKPHHNTYYVARHRSLFCHMVVCTYDDDHDYVARGVILPNYDGDGDAPKTVEFIAPETTPAVLGR